MGNADNRDIRRIIRGTVSVCPVCMNRIPADIVACGDEVYMEKSCELHGQFRTLIWKGKPDYESWTSPKLPSRPVDPLTEEAKGCPYDCGLCPQHRQHSCCVLLELTNRCNLACPVCFARAGEGDAVKEPTLEEIGNWYDTMIECGGPFNIQLSGGEPAMRDDLEEIIRLGKEKGFHFFQLNTNGLRLAVDKDYVRRLKSAGLSCVFLQFDGIRETTYERLRGRRLFDAKKQAIANCREAGLGIVLVPVIAKGINEDEVGDILQFAWENMPAVRGVHFQPMSFFGRCEAGDETQRFTLPELLQAIEKQTRGHMKMKDFKPAGAENAYCSFSGNFMKLEDGTIRPWQVEAGCGCGAHADRIPEAKEAAKHAQAFVAKRWSAGPKCHCKEPEEKKTEQYDTSSLDNFIKRLDTCSLAVSAMGFMDAWNLDLERLKDCYIHVAAAGKKGVRLIPFCAYNLTSVDGNALYRQNGEEM